MTPNVRQSREDNLLKIKAYYIRAKFCENKQSEKFDSETSKLQPVNLSETFRNIMGVHQRAADFVQSLLSMYIYHFSTVVDFSS